MRILCAAIGAAFLGLAGCASAQTADVTGTATTLGDLQNGGYVLVMRHASSPHNQTGATGLSEGCKLEAGRGLDAKGFVQAREIGAFLRENNIPVLKAYTSPMCRSWDTAMLAAAGAEVIANPSQITTNQTAIAAFKKEIEAELAANPGQNIILSNHSNIAPLYGAIVRGDEEDIPEGVVSIVTAPGWNGIDGAILRITAEVGFEAKTVTLE
ncbi:MAG: hypothetical protein DHS20C05_22990 [Hyphococcus sp.]|nr:MAG: hypothetical protein DHS20C05_22990 [Marinicaulis sp.]